MDKQGYTRKEVMSILNVSYDKVSELIKSNKLKVVVIDSKKVISYESLFIVKKDFEERRHIPKPVWIHRNNA